jgi:hypothetical protein
MSNPGEDAAYANGFAAAREEIQALKAGLMEAINIAHGSGDLKWQAEARLLELKELVEYCESQDGS